MAHRRTLTLPEEQKRELMRIRDRDSRPWARERCAAML